MVVVGVAILTTTSRNRTRVAPVQALESKAGFSVRRGWRASWRRTAIANGGGPKCLAEGNFPSSLAARLVVVVVGKSQALVWPESTPRTLQFACAQRACLLV